LILRDAARIVEKTGHAMNSRYHRAIGLLAFAACTGCAEYRAENPALTQYPGIQSQIENFYDANATEGDWTCDSPQMNTIDKSQVVGQSPAQVRIAVTYYFQSSDLSTRQGGCQGFNTRFFTFDKGPGGQLSLASMSGPQRGQNG
jgi:hypothetical protein